MVRPLVVITDYIINFEYIVENLCKNKDKPLLLCYGSCYVSEKLVSGNYLDLSKSKSNSQNTKIEIFSPVFTLLNTLPYTVELYWKSLSNKIYFFKNLKLISFIKRDFKPPQF